MLMYYSYIPLFRLLLPCAGCLNHVFQRPAKRCILALLALLTAFGGAAMAGEAPLSLAWQTAGGSELLRLDGQRLVSREPLPDTLQAPLGLSLIHI